VHAADARAAEAEDALEAVQRDADARASTIRRARGCVVFVGRVVGLHVCSSCGVRASMVRCNVQAYMRMRLQPRSSRAPARVGMLGWPWRCAARVLSCCRQLEAWGAAGQGGNEMTGRNQGW